MNKIKEVILYLSIFALYYFLTTHFYPPKDFYDKAVALILSLLVVYTIDLIKDKLRQL